MIEEEDVGLVYVGKIVMIESIPCADLIVVAHVVCGPGGKWRGIVRYSDFSVDDKCLVYLPDSLVPPSEEMEFMRKTHWRVKMRRFMGSPSEVVIMPIPWNSGLSVGMDVTKEMEVTKYHKPIPSNLVGKAKGVFPSFIPRTDEPNYQKEPDLVEALHGKPYYVTEKADGSSTTAFKYKGEFGLCSRNLELLKDEKNGYWQVAAKYDLENKLPEGYALQWETCGPKIQRNRMRLKELDGFAFSAYSIQDHRYLTMAEFFYFCDEMKFPTVRLLNFGVSFDREHISVLGHGQYSSGQEREGVVVRSQYNMSEIAPISFKVINLDYEK